MDLGGGRGEGMGERGETDLEESDCVHYGRNTETAWTHIGKEEEEW